MNKSPTVLYALFIGAILCALSVFGSALAASPQHGFQLKEYELFHDVLHPLEHDALPKKDYPRIRSQAKELVRLGRDIVKLGVPRNSAVRDELTKELKKFDKALTRFSRAAKSRDNSRLVKEYSAVHDSFEMLASLSRRVNP